MRLLGFLVEISSTDLEIGLVAGKDGQGVDVRILDCCIVRLLGEDFAELVLVSLERLDRFSDWDVRAISQVWNEVGDWDWKLRKLHCDRDSPVREGRSRHPEGSWS